MAKEINFNENKPLDVESMNKLLQDSQIVQTTGDGTDLLMSQKAITDFINNQITQSVGESTTKVMSQNAVSNELKKRAYNEFSDSNSAKQYIGKYFYNTVLSSGIHILTNCHGSITVSGESAEIYVNNSPKLIINGKNRNNWRNIYKDGRAEYYENMHQTVYNNRTNQEIYSGLYRNGDNFNLFMDSYYTPLVHYNVCRTSDVEPNKVIYISVGATFWNSPSDSIRFVLTVDKGANKLSGSINKFSDANSNASVNTNMRRIYLWREMR